MLFKNVIINLEGPICSCHGQDLGWGIYGKNGNYGLSVFCLNCKISVFVPPDKFIADFNLDKKYPGGIATDTKPGQPKVRSLTEFDKNYLIKLGVKPE